MSGLHFAVSPLPVHRKLASSDPHQTSCKEAGGPWKTSPGRGREEEGRGAGREAPFLHGCGAKWRSCSFGLVPSPVPNLTYLAEPPPPNIPPYFVFLPPTLARRDQRYGSDYTLCVANGVQSNYDETDRNLTLILKCQFYDCFRWRETVKWSNICKLSG